MSLFSYEWFIRQALFHVKGFHNLGLDTHTYTVTYMLTHKTGMHLV